MPDEQDDTSRSEDAAHEEASPAPDDAHDAPVDDAPAGDPGDVGGADDAGQTDAPHGERRSAAESLAQEALHAAQRAVADLNNDDADAAGGPDAAADALRAAQEAVAGLSSGAGASNADGDPVEMPDLSDFQDATGEDAPGGLDLLSDVNLHVKIELGRTRMYLEDVLRLGEGSVVELDKLAGDPVDVYVNGRHVARGEVLILNDNFCVRINDIVNAPAPE